ncbi:MAG: MarC family protein [Bacteroidia bacterium]|jgi:multiple antibiotic resistance protein|nr:MarC family protein [Bacteroidota bacterium]MBP6513085.1 MarC family protein [Bacteroidia bacterium]MBP7245800.1 MarC family protein [Bacteroidia bacterium]
MNLVFKDILSISMILFAVIDIIGSLPVIIETRKRVGLIHAEKATIASLIIMVLFLFLGESILNLIGIDVSSFAIAGSLVIFFLALEMILGIRLYKDEVPETASIVPIAFPLIAGTGTMTTLISLQSQYSTENILVGIAVNMIVVYIVLRLVEPIEKLLGKAGISIIRKVFGIVLMAIAIKLFRTNLGF